MNSSHFNLQESLYKSPKGLMLDINSFISSPRERET